MWSRRPVRWLLGLLAAWAVRSEDGAAPACCSGSCKLSLHGGEDRFDLASACGSGTKDVIGEDDAGTTFQVAVCPGCSVLCAPENGEAGYGAVVQSVGQVPPTDRSSCTDPRTGLPVNCTAPCAVVAEWDGVTYSTLADAGTSRPGALVAAFRPVPASPAGPFASQCAGSRLLQDWLSHGVAIANTSDGFFRVQVINRCAAGQPQPVVVNVTSPDPTDPCRIDVHVASQAGCPGLNLSVPWVMFVGVSGIVCLSGLAGALVRFVSHGECTAPRLPCGCGTPLVLLWRIAMAARDIAVFSIAVRLGCGGQKRLDEATVALASSRAGLVRLRCCAQCAASRRADDYVEVHDLDDIDG